MEDSTDLPVRSAQELSNQGRGGRRGGGNQRNRHRGGRGVQGNASGHDNPRPTGGRANFNGRLTQETPKTGVMKPATATRERQASVASTDAEVCFICASPVVHNAVSPCNHRTCHICALRLRALYKTKACAHCRTESQFVIFTDDPIKRFEEYAESDFVQTDSLGIKYEKNDIYEDTVLLLRFNCPDEACDVACTGWNDLQRHVKAIHHKGMCDLCIRNKKVFTHEHELFTRDELRKHEKFGDDNPGAIDQSGFKGHPECGFCRQRFYGDDELYAHCRDKHERCHICDRRNTHQQQNYFQNYDSLEIHFRKDHFLCMERDCLDKKFVVFESEMDLKGHQLETHPGVLSKDARKDARRVDMSDFDYRQQYQQERGGRNGNRGRGRGRDPNTDPLPQSTAQPLRRDEIAYQRQMAIQSAQSVTARTFGGQLTSFNPQPAPQSRATPPPSALVPVEPGPSQPQTPQERARALRHEAVLKRATDLLNGSAEKLTYFRNTISSYRSSNISAADLISLFANLFPVSTTELGTLIRDLADIYENPQKREDLLKSWNDYKATKDSETTREDYPALPLSAQRNSAASGMRVLRLKSSTAQSSRSRVNRENSWGSASSSPATSASGAFPPISNSTSSRKPAASSSPWAGGESSSSSNNAGSASRPAPAPTSRPKINPAIGASSEAFPALPPVMQSKHVFGYGLSGNSKNRAVNSPWGALNALGARDNDPPPGFGGPVGATANGAAEGEGSAAGGADAKKKGGRKKQVLFHYG